jgi:hypothetical protein
MVAGSPSTAVAPLLLGPPAVVRRNQAIGPRHRGLTLGAPSTLETKRR